MTGATPHVRCERRGHAGLVTLDRADALNALSGAMIAAIDDALDRHLDDDAVAHVVLRSAAPRVFSAGGDIRELHGAIVAARAGVEDPPTDFFRREYRLDHRIAIATKPVVSLIDGVVMGGGAGVSINGRFRVAGDGFRFAMPEVGIGFFPDVGATFFLTQLPDALGRWLGLTGARIDADLAVWSGLATHRVSSDAFPTLLDRLAGTRDTEDALHSFAGPVPPPDARPWEDTFGTPDPGDILAALDHRAAGGDAFASRARDAMRAASPTSLAIAGRQLGRDAAPTLADALRTEFRIVSRVLAGHDFPEGVRAQIIEKDRRPRWRPDRLEDVEPQAIDAYFRPLEEELVL